MSSKPMSLSSSFIFSVVVAAILICLIPTNVTSQSTTSTTTTRTNRIRQAIVVRRQRPLNGDVSSSAANSSTPATTDELEKDVSDEIEDGQVSKSNGRILSGYCQ